MREVSWSISCLQDRVGLGSSSLVATRVGVEVVGIRVGRLNWLRWVRAPCLDDLRLLVNMRLRDERSSHVELRGGLELVVGVSVLTIHGSIPHLDLLLLHRPVLLSLRLNWCRHVSGALKSRVLLDRLGLSVYDNSFDL